MIIKRIPGATRIMAKDQPEYRQLPILDTLMPDGKTPVMASSWEPTPDELARLNAGAHVILWIVGSSHPPVMIEVDAVPTLTGG